MLLESLKEKTRGTAPSQRARRPPRKLPLLGPLRKYGAYVIQGMREMTVIRCLIVEKSVASGRDDLGVSGCSVFHSKKQMQFPGEMNTEILGGLYLIVKIKYSFW